MAKKAVKKATKVEKPKSPKSKVVRKTAPATTEKKVARKTTAKKKDSVEKGSSDKKTPKPGKGAVKIDSSSKSESETSEMDKLDTIIYSKSRKESQHQSEVEGKSRRGKAVKKEAKVEVPTESGDSRDKKQGHSSQESFMRKSAQQQVSGKVDTQSISEELSKLIKKIEVKKVQGSSISPTDKTKKGSSKHKQKVTAKSVGYTVKLNPKNKATPVINLFDLAKKSEYNNTDIILSIIEIAYHRDCYIFPSSPKSNSFWEEIVQFNEFKRIFQFLRPETLKKYWRLLSWKDAMGYAIKIIEKHKKFLDEKKPKLLRIITGIQNYSAKKISSFTDYIVNHHKYLNLGIPSEVEAQLTGKKREKVIERRYRGDNYTEEIKRFMTKDSSHPIVLLEEKDEVKRLAGGLRTINNKENRKLFRFTEEDKFIFSCIDNVVEGLCKENKEATRELVVNALKINTLNIPQTHEYLKKPYLPLNEKTIFNTGDDHVIRYMKHSQFYKELTDNKGKENVENREYFLS